MSNQTKESAARTLYAVMNEMAVRPDNYISTKEIKPIVESKVELTDWERERTGKNNTIRWRNNLNYYSIWYVKAGFIIKNKNRGYWYLTPDGAEIIKNSAEDVMNSAEDAFKKWQKEQKQFVGTLDEDSELYSNEASAKEDLTDDVDIDVDVDLEGKARNGIRAYLSTKTPYEFQDMVAALLHAMGYHIPFVAPQGRDDGIDIIAYVDPIGAQIPRVKVQVKHRIDAIGAPEIRQLLGNIRKGEIALFVTSGTFTKDAKKLEHLPISQEFIRLIDGDDFIDMWQEYYDKMTKEERNMLPLKRITFLDSNE